MIRGPESRMLIPLAATRSYRMETQWSIEPARRLAGMIEDKIASLANTTVPDQAQIVDVAEDLRGIGVLVDTITFHAGVEFRERNEARKARGLKPILFPDDRMAFYDRIPTQEYIPEVEQMIVDKRRSLQVESNSQNP